MKKTVCIAALLLAPAAHAWDCAHEKVIDEVLDLSGSEQLEVQAAAGDLTIRGDRGSEARIRGRVCVSDEDWLEQARIVTRGGTRAEIKVDLPTASGWSLTGGEYATMDLEIDVPATLDITLKDSSGDTEVVGVASLQVSDSSGDVEIRDVERDVVVDDSSGDIEIEDVRGDVTVERDSSGDIEVRGIEGSVLIARDSSGSIYVRDIGKDATVDRDSSGDITAIDVGGDFTVHRDGSGGIEYRNVQGSVSVPDEG
ncbi:MAG: DUF4097 domain-containing protein [Gammaproteobacteria bacterium]|nr:DUF4097 domain-containing protein [Gammaproteobacteria bacterium]